MSRIKEQLVHVAQFIDGQTAADQDVEVLEGVLCPVSDMMSAQHSSGVAIQDQLLESRQMRMRHGVKHGPVAGRQADVQPIGIIGRHFQDDDVAIARPRLLLSQAEPAHFVMRVEKIRPIRWPITHILAHNGARGVGSAFSRLEHFHRGPDQVAGCINIGNRGAQLLIDHNSASVVDGDAERIDRGA